MQEMGESSAMKWLWLKLVIQICCVVWVARMTSGVQGEEDEQQQLLQSLGSSWNDTKGVLLSWKISNPLSKWYGVVMAEGVIKEIVVTGGGLEGNIDTLGVFSQLQTLTKLDLNLNSFNGFFPDSLLNLSHLTYLDLSGNLLTGNLPSQIHRISQLEYLDLSSNLFSSIIPTSIGNLSLLAFLRLGQNKFTGHVPLDLGNLQKLTFLGIAYNRLLSSWPIPNSFGQFKNLRKLSADSSNVKGELDSAIFQNLTKLEVVSLSMNSITGEIPNTLFDLENIKKIYFWKNKLSGNIPPKIVSTKLVELDLSENQLSGAIPESIGSLKQLELLFLFDNNLTNTIPASLPSLPNLQELDISNNQLVGPLPPDLCYFNPLRRLYLFNNQLSGDITNAINCSTLEEINLSINNFDGVIPAAVGALSKLKILDISHNNLSGAIPLDLGMIATQLSFLDLSYNNLSGEIPMPLQISTFANSFVHNDYLCAANASTLHVPSCT